MDNLNTSDAQSPADLPDSGTDLGMPAGGPLFDADADNSGDDAKTTKKTTKKKTAKKAAKKTAKKAAKKTAKKAAKKAAKKTAKKAAKKAAKKTAKKTTKKKVSKKAAEADAESEADTADARPMDEVAPVDEHESPSDKAAEAVSDDAAADESASEDKPKKKTRRRTRRTKASAESDGESDGAQAESGSADDSDVETESASDEKPKKKARRSRRTSKTTGKTAEKSDEKTDGDAKSSDREDDKRSRGRRSSSSGDRSRQRRGRDRYVAKPGDGEPMESVHVAPSADGVKRDMLISYHPGEDCRLAIVEDGKLEDFYSEPTSSVSRVGNIYVGRVTNVEGGIQAAFVNFGLEEAAFLHQSDLHPRYFPGGKDDTERVGFKTPRRDRPPIEKCLKRGQEIMVQVLKEGVGTKGPSVTSYLSIPGRYLVMMPGMDRVGVSRKVESDDQRRKMREILDSLNLPDGFGFILRTAGFEATQEELESDLAYLMRLWDDMESRRKGGGGPRLLYSESDLLVRTVRDQLSSAFDRVVIDSELALRRVSAFMRIAAPRAHSKLLHYKGAAPIFHAFGVEEQIELMHANEVPLPSGGRLVIDQTEALVAIDVNSGKSRAARDPEQNAFETNMEAVDEICRQLRLRDLGGLVINDLIDMRHASNREKVEQRFLDRLSRDKARSTILPISRFGILEMTRQRMRGSYEQQHFRVCPTCEGRGLIQRAASTASRALRELTALLDHDRVAKVELVVGPRVAGALLGEKRASLSRIERASGRTVQVHVKETIAPTRFILYAYDERGNDIDIARLPKARRKPQVEAWKPDESDTAYAADPAAEALLAKQVQDAEADAHEEAEVERIAAEPIQGAEKVEQSSEDEESGGRKRRRRRRRRRRSGDGEGSESSGEQETATDEAKSAESESSAEQSDDEGSEEREGSRRRRRRRRRRGSGDGEASNEEATADTSDAGEGDDPSDAASGNGPSSDDEGERRPRRRRRRRRSSGSDESTESSSEGSAASEPAESRTTSDGDVEPKPKRRRSGRSSSKSDEGSSSGGSKGEASAESDGDDGSKKRRRRTLYGARRALTVSERASLDKE